MVNRVNHLLKPSRQIAEQGVILGGLIMANSLKTAQFLVESRLRDAARGDSNACFDFGIFYSTGTGGESIDLVKAHKWFNLAAVHDSEEAQMCRAATAEGMSAREKNGREPGREKGC